MEVSTGRESQQPKLDIIEPSIPSYNSFPQKSNYVRDVSFSSYIKPDEPDHQLDDSEISIFDAQKYFNESTGSDPKVSKRVSPVNAINLERISEGCDLSAMVPRFSSASSADGCGRNCRARSFHATPTASSEASWNSQTGLLSKPPGAITVSMRNPTAREKKRLSATKWLLGRKCPCSGKKSVQVQEKKVSDQRQKSTNANLKKDQIPNPVQNVVEKSLPTSDCIEKQDEAPSCHRISTETRFPASQFGQRVLASSGRSFRDGSNGFTFPILNRSAPTKVVLNGAPSSTINPPPPLEDPPRDSLEVFQLSDEPISFQSTETQPRMLVSRSSFTVPDDDIASDGSSDLFEIESFSTQSQTTSSHPMYRQDSLDEASGYSSRRLTTTNGALFCRRSLDESMTPSIAPTECYEPSEASIDWSVTTAEGFDRGSVTNFSITASEADNVTITRGHESDKNTGGSGGGGNGGRRRGNGLLGCRCEKAVNVGPHPVRCVGPEGQKMGPPIPASTALRHVSSRPATVSKPPPARSHSARLSRPFAT